MDTGPLTIHQTDLTAPQADWWRMQLVMPLVWLYKQTPAALTFQSWKQGELMLLHLTSSNISARQCSRYCQTAAGQLSFSLAISPLGTALQSNRGQVYPNKNILECLWHKSLPKGLNCVTSGEKNYDLKEKFKALVHQEKELACSIILTLGHHIIFSLFSFCYIWKQFGQS